MRRIAKRARTPVVSVNGERAPEEDPPGPAPHQDANREARPRARRPDPRLYCTALIMSKIGRYIATIMPPTMTPSTTIMMGSMAASSASTAASTSSS